MERDEVMGMAAQAVQDTEKDCRDGAIVPFVLRFAALVEAAATEKANERANASWASMCEKMVAAEREAMVSAAAKLGWAMKNEDPFEDAVAEVSRIRAAVNTPVAAADTGSGTAEPAERADC